MRFRRLRCIVISKEHLQPYIWVVPSLFQVICSELVFSRDCVSFKQALAVIPFFKVIELIRKSSCSHPFDELLFSIIRVTAATHSFKFTVFAEQELEPGDTINTYHDTFLVSSMLTLEEVCYITTSFSAIHVFYDSVIISLEHAKRSICQGQCLFQNTYCNHLYSKRSVADLRKIEEYVYLRKTIVALIS